MVRYLKSLNTFSSLILLTSLTLLQFSLANNSDFEDKSRNTPPQFYDVSTQCSKDSPEIYYEIVGLPNLNTLLDEGKVFFGVLMENLEASVSDSEDMEKLTKEWESLSEIVINSFDLAAHRIDGTWEKIIQDFDVRPSPWELSWRKLIIVEEFMRLHYEYQILEAVLKSGVKEIVGTLQTQLVDVMKQLENKVLKAGDGVTEEKLLQSMESNLKQLQPNFVGKLLTAIVQRAMRKENRKANTPAIATYVSESLDKIALVVEAYRNKGEEFPHFWMEMSQIMKNDGRKPMSVPDMLTIYGGDEELIIHNIISLLSKAKDKQRN